MRTRAVEPRCSITSSRHPVFERFYRDHIKKMLLVRRGRRYVSKGNYNLSRLAYLRRLFPDARFVVLVREPTWHIASLAKQHRLFEREETRDARILKHMQRSGHFEFGLDRRAIDLGDGTAADVERLWREGNEVRAGPGTGHRSTGSSLSRRSATGRWATP